MGGFKVERADGGHTHFGSYSSFQCYTGLLWAGYANLTDEELEWLARASYGNQTNLDHIKDQVREFRRALPEVEQKKPELAAALRHDLRLYEGWLSELERGHTTGQLEMFELQERT